MVTDKEKSDTQHHKHKRSEKDDDSNPLHKSKRRKHQHHLHNEDAIPLHPFRTNHPVKEFSKHHLITHYVIQLEAFDGDSRKVRATESQSSASTAVEAQMLGMTKAEVRRLRIRGGMKTKDSSDIDEREQENLGGDDEEEEMQSEDVSESLQHVSAIG